MDSLAKIRLEHARSLLRHTDSPLAYVAAESGFTDVNTFIRSFKKWYGITPGRFRETAG
jgi:AraC-like DNA-binding protein